MYFEYLGIANAMEGVIGISMTMMVGPFSSEGERVAFLEKCHKVVTRGKSNPHQIKFVLHETLPINEPDENEFEITDNGEVVPARPLQWRASLPEKFLEFLKGI